MADSPGSVKGLSGFESKITQILETKKNRITLKQQPWKSLKNQVPSLRKNTVFLCTVEPTRTFGFCKNGSKLKAKKQSNTYTMTRKLLSLNFIQTTSANLSQRQRECYATTTVRKVELILEFNFLSGSNFLSRLVLQVISVPFVVWINTAVAPRWLFCLLTVSLRGFYWSTFRCLAGLANKDCVSSKARTLSVMRGK